MITSEQRAQAENTVPEAWLPLSTEEAVIVLDALADGKEPTDHLDEYRFWRTRLGRQVETDELFESAHPLDLLRAIWTAT